MIIENKEEFEELIKKPRKYLKYANKDSLKINYQYDTKFDSLVKALFIKNRKERITFIYDNACDIIDEYNATHSLNCSFTNGRCDAYKNSRINGCCYHCRLQTSTGCPSRNLSCKFFFCEKLDKLNHLYFEDFPEFNLLTYRQRIIARSNYYCKREKFLKLLFINSLFVFYLYSVRNSFNMTIADLENRRLEKTVNRI